MRNMSLNEIREKYLSFFESKGHLRMQSFSLVPKNDPSILLINAGMTPLKPYFTGVATPPAPRVTTCQKCIRTPDIERVGKTSRHGTYFEMLGNFSFGDYFKEDAISWAWEFVTQVLEMPEEKLFVTVFEEDDEAYKIWNEVVGLPKEKIFRMGREDNFWEHGTGPCGPCSEIFFDMGEDPKCKNPGTCAVGCDCDRFVEFWNLVFTQFNKEEDGTYTHLAKKNIDTGGGLERFACIMQGVGNLFEVDTIRAILDYICQVIGVTYGQDAKTDTAIRVITDHARSTTMMICDGILPDNAGRGYVLRRLIRRASRFARLLGKQETFLSDVAAIVIRESKGAYPKLAEKESFIKSVIHKEEESFARTINQGLTILNDYLDQVRKSDEKNNDKGNDKGNGNILPGEYVFKLHDTFGFPMDLTREIANENGIMIDEAGFHETMAQQKKITREIALKNRAGAAWGAQDLPDNLASSLVKTEFIGYTDLECETTIKYLITGEDVPLLTEEVGVGETVTAIFDRSPFYAQSGGQAGDIGEIRGADFTIRVTSSKKTEQGVILHTGTVEEGVAAMGSLVTLSVDRENRMSTARNHTTTHLLHKALRMVLGEHVAQAGSDVSSQRLRFDFSHFEAMTDDQKDLVEQIVNKEILKDDPVSTQVMSVDEAKSTGAMALFDEKYGDKVRVVSVGDYSKELCGGTHLGSTSQACLFRILSETGIAAGVRRIEAVTGEAAMSLVRAQDILLKDAAALMKTSPADVLKRAEAIIAESKALAKRLEMQNDILEKSKAKALLSKAGEIKGMKFIFEKVDADGMEELRNLADKLRDLIGEGVVVLACANDDKVSIIAMATKNAVLAGAHAGNIIKEAAKVCGGGGGGRPDMAQAGGKNVEAIGEAVAKAKEIAYQQLGI
ncbi:MAG: alanine--tRNA ligase [Saccharofermentanales bacterium]